MQQKEIVNLRKKILISRSKLISLSWNDASIEYFNDVDDNDKNYNDEDDIADNKILILFN